jgi:hypothetical protein
MSTTQEQSPECRHRVLLEKPGLVRPPEIVIDQDRSWSLVLYVMFVFSGMLLVGSDLVVGGASEGMRVAGLVWGGLWAFTMFWRRVVEWVEG